MPTYEYQCKTCGQVFDLYQSITDKPLRSAPCEHCGKSRKVERLIGTGAALLFKGSGFYQTDYRSDSYKKAASAETKPAAAADKKPPDTKSDAKKPAAAKPAKTDASKKSHS
jgi:putative FmdB family regulatory protein